MTLPVAGAGYHKSHGKYNKLTKLACKAGALILRDGGTALEAVKVAVMGNVTYLLSFI